MRDYERIRESLDKEQDELRVQRMWRRIEAARTPAVKKRRVPYVALGVGLAAVAAVALVSMRTPESVDDSTAGLAASLSSDGMAQRITLSNGSVIALEQGARLEVIDRSTRNVELALRRGKVSFDVKSTASSAWRVDCGSVTIAFTGAALSIDRGAREVHVHVRRGAVVVRGEGVPDGVRRVHEGERIGVPLHAHELVGDDAHARVPAPDPLVVPEPEAPLAAPIEARAVPTLVAETRAPEPRVIPTIPWRESAAAGNFDEAYATLGAAGIERESGPAATADDLFALADVARLSGHPSQAVVPLERLVDVHSRDPRAALASYSLAQLYLDRLNRPGDAAHAYTRGLALGLPRSLQELATARRVEALGRAHSPDVASAAQAYLDRYPEGTYRAHVERWVAP